MINFTKLSNILIACLIGCNLLAQTPFENPIKKQGRLGSPLVETSPFVFNDKLYLLENNQQFWDVPGAKPGDYFQKDEIRIRDLESGKLISVPLKNHGFGTVLTWKGTVYVFAGNYGTEKPWRQMTEITMTSSKDLKNWSNPRIVLRASGQEFFFNTAVCRGKDKFILLYETNDPKWKPFTFRYLESTDLINWKEIPNAVYGSEKYVGGPALYYEGDWYYTLYLESIKGGYETRITRSKDLVSWEDVKENRPFITFDPTHKNIPLIKPTVSESNASDVELCYFNGKTILYFTGSDQTTAGDLQWATYEGTPKQLFEHFFEDNERNLVAPPEHKGNWTPVLTAPQELTTMGTTHELKGSKKPSPQQLAFQERQLGAFIHYGPAAYIASDFMSVPAANVFNPTQLDAEQWVKTAKSFGAKHIVLTAKHHNGYCLWPTETTDYSIKGSPWKNGKGDVVGEFVKACRKYNIEIGLYVSGGDKHFGCSSTPDPQGERKMVGDIHKYFPVFMEQLRELLTNYGEISYLWFDGAYDPFGWDVMDPKTMQPLGTAYGDAIHSMVRHLQPDAVIMGGTKPDVRWSGSEQGWAAYPLENIVRPGEGLEMWVGPQNAGWIPAEANLHTRSTWFWTPDSDKTLRDIPFLKNVYFETIGRGANLLVNMTPDTTGLIPEAEVERLNEFGKSLENTFAKPLGSTSSKVDRPNNQLVIDFPKKLKMNLLVLEEDIQHGQHIDTYKVEAYVDRQWKTIAEGQSIGRKRIQTFPVTKTSKLRLTLEGEDNRMFINNFTVYFSEK
ncbi:hypothetical protein DHD05_21715 [Arenibacter sp. N53]|uniref:alpha-L-fucosidase n=1 Tax=Arenibacter TaxID=178469 RepID=UPI000CD3FFE4|nr:MULTISPECIES: alpha-L-fucosidase [Arenibacter]MCM4154214.1 hypothetical protein [Arenibacter sp. N53]